MAWEKNIGSFVKDKYAGYGTATAGGTGDATEVTGTTIDRSGYQSGVIGIAYTATLAATKTLKFTVKRAESADGTNWDTAVTLKDAVVVATGATGGSTETGVLEIDEDFSGMKRYVHYLVTPDLSATGTDVATWMAVATLGGAVVIPA
jgi:hypothetical protein